MRFFGFSGKFAESNTHKKVSISSETMRHQMRMFDTVLERPKVILLVLESLRDIPVILGNTWSTSVDLMVAQN